MTSYIYRPNRIIIICSLEMKLGVAVVSYFFYFVAFLIQNQVSHGCLENERIGLLEIKDYILSLGRNEYNELELGSWVEDRISNCCAWNRIKCSNISSGHVTHLSLDNLNSRGEHLINGSLFSPFEELLNLNLSSNGYQGWISKGYFLVPTTILHHIGFSTSIFR